MAKSITKSSVQKDIKWTKYYINLVKECHDAGDYEQAAQWANEISAIWGGIQGEFLEASEKQQ